MHTCDVVVLMGMKELDIGGIRRDLAVLPTKHEALIGQKILQKLFDSENPDLGLQAVEIALEEFEKSNIYEQRNVKPSRKQILPMIKQILDENEYF